MRKSHMKYLAFIALTVVLTMFSCQKEIIVPVQQGEEEIFNTRGSSRNPFDEDGGNSGNGSVTDPDNETEDEKVKKKKKTTSN
jgi:hypothetical protein